MPRTIDGNELKAGDQVVDKTAKENGWPDVEGRVLQVDGPHVQVEYSSGNIRFKLAVNLQLKEEGEIQELLEQLEGEMDVAAELVEMGGSMPLNELEPFEIGLSQCPERAISAMFKKFEVDPENLNIHFVHQYQMLGTPGTPGEGQIAVTVYRTNHPGVFLGRYVYQNGDTVWVIRPEQRTDET